MRYRTLAICAAVFLLFTLSILVYHTSGSDATSPGITLEPEQITANAVYQVEFRDPSAGWVISGNVEFDGFTSVSDVRFYIIYSSPSYVIRSTPVKIQLNKAVEDILTVANALREGKIESSQSTSKTIVYVYMDPSTRSTTLLKCTADSVSTVKLGDSIVRIYYRSDQPFPPLLFEYQRETLEGIGELIMLSYYSSCGKVVPSPRIKLALGLTALAVILASALAVAFRPKPARIPGLIIIRY